jgi:hypothetical protein
MRVSLVRLAAGSAIAFALVIGAASTANAQSVMKVCGDQWKTAKAAGTTNGETWPQFLAQCRTQQTGAAAPAPTTYAPPAAPPQTYGQAPTAGTGMTTSQCDAKYAANKAAIKASGQTKRAFVAACRAGNATIPQGTATAPPPTAAPAPAPAPAPTGSLFPWSQPAAPAPAPAPANYGSAPTPTAAGEFASEQQARYRCPSDTVVWVNTKSRIYHFAGTSNYGNTKHGAYICEGDARASGDRAAENERHP